MFQNYNENDNTLLPETPLYNLSLCRYFERQLMNLIKAQFEFTGVPKVWDYDYFTDTLFRTGKVCILDVPRYGVIPQKATLHGIDVFGKPSRFIVTNPLFPRTIEGRIHRDGVIVKLFPDYGGYHTTIRAYAARIACAMEAVDVSVANAKPTIVLYAENDKQAASLKRGMSDAMRCKPYIILNKGMGKDSIGMVQPNIAQNFLAPELLQTINSLMAGFKDSVGVFHQNNEKKANLLNAEVENSQAQVTNQLKMVVDCVNRGLDEANAKYGLDIHFQQSIESPDTMTGEEENEDLRD